MILVIHGPSPVIREIMPAGPDNWLVGEPGRRSTSSTNDAGLAWALANWRQRCDMTPTDLNRERNQCVMELDGMQCPCNFICQHKRKRDTAIIVCSNYEPYLQPVGQMSLFDQVSHRPAWRHRHTGRVVETEQRPVVSVSSIICKRMSVIILHKLQKLHPDMAYWRIVPCDRGKAARMWLTEMAEKNPREKACVFDEWGMSNPLSPLMAKGFYR